MKAVLKALKSWWRFQRSSLCCRHRNADVITSPNGVFLRCKNCGDTKRLKVKFEEPTICRS